MITPFLQNVSNLGNETPKSELTSQISRKGGNERVTFGEDIFFNSGYFPPKKPSTQNPAPSINFSVIKALSTHLSYCRSIYNKETNRNALDHAV